ncbi:MAG: diacylglycerol kinase family protein [Bacillaceae bacterium]|nr:diacylglycerol kinase family protein [Bacillaceae bacterium]
MSLDSKDPKKRGIGFSFALRGIYCVFQSEINFKIHVIASILVTILGFYFHLSAIEWLFVLFAIGIVLVSEILNTAIEQIVNYLFTEYHPTAGKIKDIAAGAVLAASIIAALIGFIIFIPKIVHF